MFRTIQLSSRVSVQGRFVESLENGEVVISDGVRNWQGRPIEYSRILKNAPVAVAQTLGTSDALGAA